MHRECAPRRRPAGLDRAVGSTAARAAALGHGSTRGDRCARREPARASRRRSTGCAPSRTRSTRPSSRREGSTMRSAERRLRRESSRRSTWRSSADTRRGSKQHCTSAAAQCSKSLPPSRMASARDDQDLRDGECGRARGRHPRLLSTGKPRELLGPSRDRIDALGGVLVVEATEDRGTRFTVTVPLL